ncbi:S9 family peptidase [Sulfobacillus thermosulfidooxidans]|uniref:S9 family peptidase n=1 Tax=Sulfobacillus thermosulfidooxidans TaxID=28034 RepID=UPI0003F4E8A4|nr:alpha/beta fold hydrolase [Sulfobacillus thermosulfidooxidans]
MSEWEFGPPDIEDFFRYANITAFSVSDDEQSIAVATNLGGTFDLWGLTIGIHYPHQLSHMGQMIHDVHYDPAGRYILFSADHDGDENTQMYLLPPQGGTAKILREAPSHKQLILHVSEDGNRLYYASDRENPSFFNNYRLNLETGEEELLVKGEGGATYIAQVSPNERVFVVLKLFANTFIAGFIVQDGIWHAIVPNPQTPHVVYGAEFIDDGHLYVTTNYEREFSYLAKYDLATQQFSPVAQIEGQDLADLKWDKERQRLYVLAHAGVEDRFYVMDLTVNNPSLQPIDLPVSLVTSWTVARSGTVYVMGQSEIMPNNLFRYTPGSPWTPITDNRSMGIDPNTAVHAEVVHYPSFDGTIIEALWFSPPAERRNGYTIIWPHGGPQYAERRQFRSIVQYFVHEGYQFFAPNFRGSTGYGKTFTTLVEGDWGEGPRKDMVSGIEWLFRMNMAQKDKLFLMGGSYGGYMSLLLHGRHPEYFKAVVDIFGPSNLFTFHDSVPESWKPVMDIFLGNPVTQAEKFREDSPITYLDAMTRPMLVIQGANDPRVVKQESDQLVEALRARGRDIEYMVLEDEGHGFSKKANEIAVYRKIAEFFRQHQ